MPCDTFIFFLKSLWANKLHFEWSWIYKTLFDHHIAEQWSEELQVQQQQQKAQQSNAVSLNAFIV